MKLGVIILFICAINVNTFGQIVAVPKKEYIFKNKVKSLTCFQYSYLKGNIDKNSKSKDYYEEYDSRGNRVKAIDYWCNNFLHYQITYAINEQGTVSGWKQEMFDSNGQVESVHEALCNAEGKLKEMIDYKDGIVE